MKQTTMQLHRVSTNGIDMWHTVPAYLVPRTTTWYVVKAEDEIRITQGASDHYRVFGLFHDGLVAVRFTRLRYAIDAGQRAAQLWDKPGLPEDKAGSTYQELIRIIHTAQGQRRWDR